MTKTELRNPHRQWTAIDGILTVDQIDCALILCLRIFLLRMDTKVLGRQEYKAVGGRTRTVIHF